MRVRNRSVPATRVRWMVRRDLPAVLAAENGGFAAPWAEADFLAALRRRNGIGLVAEQGDRVVGYVVYDLRDESMHLRRLAVHPDCRRRGVAAQILASVRGRLSPARRTHLTAAVPETNLAAQQFLRSQGFLATRVLRGYYPEPPEDAYVMVYAHPDAAVACAGECFLEGGAG